MLSSLILILGETDTKDGTWVAETILLTRLFLYEDTKDIS